MRTEVIFVRHGETESNHHGVLHGRTDIPLAPSGLVQAEKVATRLAQFGGPTSVYSSPLRRAVATAEQIGERLGVTAVTDPRLAEFDFGDLEGLTFDELQSMYPELYFSLIDPNGFEDSFPNGESRSSLHTRVVSVLGELLDTHQGERVIIVAHLVVIASALSHLTSGDPHDMVKYLVRNCSVTHLVINESSETTVHCLDDVEHLA